MWSSRVQQYIDSHRLLASGGLHLVALSGGADSVALLLLLAELGYRIEAVHCNFHLRGDESDRDEQFCVDLCKRLEMPLHRVHFDTTAYAAAHRVSIEMAARELRYNYFEQLRHDVGADSICVAHHRDDSVETILLNLIRGTGIDGLTGIAPRRGHIVRPLLCLSRDEIVAYLNAKGQDYVTDSTNLVDDVKRNKVRLDVIPLLRTINPSVVDSISQMARHLSEVEKAADDDRIHDIYQGEMLPIASLRQEPSAEYILWHRLKGHGFTSKQIQNIAQSLDAASGKQWISPTHTVVKDRESLIVVENEPAADREMTIPEEGIYVYGDSIRFNVQRSDVNGPLQIDPSPQTAMVDAEAVSFPLHIRRVKQGDRFSPLGMKGSRLVSDFLTDRKVNVIEKRRQLVVTDAIGRIVWLVGHRIDNHCRITPSTRQYITIKTAETR